MLKLQLSVFIVLLIIFSTLIAGKNSDDTKMVFVEGGIYEMGNIYGNGLHNEKPVHFVKLSNFYIGKYEVTQKEWLEIMGSNPSFYKGDDLPVERVNWYEAIIFCNKKSEKEGLPLCYVIDSTQKDSKNHSDFDRKKWVVTCDYSVGGYRLPTESEWEYAAKGGVKCGFHEFSGSDNMDKVAWFNANAEGKTHPVGTKMGNELGIYDMSGNVFEWCWDWYNKDYYKHSEYENPIGASEGFYRILRGGGIDYGSRHTRCSFRDYDDPFDGCYGSVGLRLVRSAGPER